MPILSAAKCNHETDYLQYDMTIDDSMICAGYVEGGVDHCFVCHTGTHVCSFGRN